MDICKVVGNNIKNLRQKKKLSQEELAFRAGVDRSYLSEVESGYKNIGISVLKQIADALDVEIAELVKNKI
jgi:transcriptional regulator with XRE-family HTH domain